MPTLAERMSLPTHPGCQLRPQDETSASCALAALIGARALIWAKIGHDLGARLGTDHRDQRRHDEGES